MPSPKQNTRNTLITATYRVTKRTTARKVKASPQPPLLRLPEELRSVIYRFILGGQEYKIHLKKEYTCIRNHKLGWINLALLGVCKKIYKETKRLPFALNTFRVLPHQMRPWSNQLSRFQVDAIGCIKLDWMECLHGRLELSLFAGLNYIRISGTPNMTLGSGRLTEITKLLRKTSGRPELTVEIERDDPIPPELALIFSGCWRSGRS